MLISELIKYCQEMQNKHGNLQVSQIIPGPQEQYKPINFTLSVSKTGWIKKRAVTEDEEITIKRRASVFRLKVDEDTN